MFQSRGFSETMIIYSNLGWKKNARFYLYIGGWGQGVLWDPWHGRGSQLPSPYFFASSPFFLLKFVFSPLIFSLSFFSSYSPKKLSPRLRQIFNNKKNLKFPIQKLYFLSIDEKMTPILRYNLKIYIFHVCICVYVCLHRCNTQVGSYIYDIRNTSIRYGYLLVNN